MINTYFDWFSSFPSQAPETTFAIANARIANRNTQRIFVHTPYPVPGDCHYFQLASPYNGPGFDIGNVLVFAGTGGSVIIDRVFAINPSHSIAMLSTTVTEPIFITDLHVVASEDCEPLNNLDRLSYRPELPMSRVHLAVPLQLLKYSPKQRISLLNVNPYLFSSLYNDIMDTHFNPDKSRERRERASRIIRSPAPKTNWGLTMLTSAFRREGHVRGAGNSSPSSSTFSCGALAHSGIAVHQEVEYHTDYAEESSGMVSGC